MGRRAGKRRVLTTALGSRSRRERDRTMSCKEPSSLNVAETSTLRVRKRPRKRGAVLVAHSTYCSSVNGS